LRERGYNQAFEIARTVGAALGVPVLTRGIVRRDAGRTQIGRGAAERHASVRAAFAVERDCAGLNLAVVDDVITTGATINALAQVLVAAGAARVDAWAVARTPAPRD
jgi:predicted amidophosphoribosyltransferase